MEIHKLEYKSRSLNPNGVTLYKLYYFWYSMESVEFLKLTLQLALQQNFLGA